MSVSSASITSGKSGTGTVTLIAAAPKGGVVISLSNSNTSAAHIPASVTVRAGETSANFTITAEKVTTQTPVTLTASYSGVQVTASVTITPQSGGGATK
jgi:hypothetical protein